MPAERVRIDVGGQIFATVTDTLTKFRAAGSHLSRLLNEEPILVDQSGTREYFIDRDPRSFGYILQWLRDERPVIVKSDSEKDRLLNECHWYGPFIGGDPKVLTETEYHHIKTFGNGNGNTLSITDPNGMPFPAGCDHSKKKFYSLQLR